MSEKSSDINALKKGDKIFVAEVGARATLLRLTRWYPISPSYTQKAKWAKVTHWYGPIPDIEHHALYTLEVRCNTEARGEDEADAIDDTEWRSAGKACYTEDVIEQVIREKTDAAEGTLVYRAKLVTP